MFSRLKWARVSMRCASWSTTGPSAPTVREYSSLGAGDPLVFDDGLLGSIGLTTPLYELSALFQIAPQQGHLQAHNATGESLYKKGRTQGR